MNCYNEQEKNINSKVNIKFHEGNEMQILF